MASGLSRIGAWEGVMQFDIDKMAAVDKFELLLGTVVPRPIALVTTLGEDGTLILPHTVNSAF